jgi:hypothetical protein
MIQQWKNRKSVRQNIWKNIFQVTVESQIRPQYWNNVGIRFSTDSDASGRPYGLQVFVNGTSVGWKRNPSLATGFPEKLISPSDMRVAVGCNLNGTGVLFGTYNIVTFTSSLLLWKLTLCSGSLEHFAVWYWRLQDTALNSLPANASQLGELAYFDGNFSFAAQPTVNATKYFPGIAVFFESDY